MSDFMKFVREKVPRGLTNEVQRRAKRVRCNAGLGARHPRETTLPTGGWTPLPEPPLLPPRPCALPLGPLFDHAPSSSRNCRGLLATRHLATFVTFLLDESQEVGVVGSYLRLRVLSCELLDGLMNATAHIRQFYPLAITAI